MLAEPANLKVGVPSQYNSPVGDHQFCTARLLQGSRVICVGNTVHSLAHSRCFFSGEKLQSIFWNKKAGSEASFLCGIDKLLSPSVPEPRYQLHGNKESSASKGYHGDSLS